MKPRLRRLLIGFLLLAGLLTAGWVWLFWGLPDPALLREQFFLPSVRLTDRHGRLLYDVVDAQSGRNLALPLAEIPLALRQATIATEDRNFYTNPGVDVEGIARALWINLQGGEVLAGGSTITQQVARNLLFTADERGERTVRRKLRESWLAWRIARTYSKDDILEIYLNQSYYGGLAYGVEAAAQTYFGQSVAQLTLAECALLAGLPQSPGVYNPLLNPTAAQERQVVVLGLLRQEGYITADDEALALRQTLRYAAEPYPIRAPHFVMMVQAELDSLYTRDQLYESGGLLVRTTLDLDWQTTAEGVVTQQLARLNNPINQPYGHQADNAALVALSPQTGDVLALVGSPDFFDDQIAGAINMAIQPRQPGSALKPFIYALALDPRQPQPLTAASMLVDVYTTFTTRKGESYIPVNFSRTEHGPVTVREALGSSLNIPAVQTLARVGVDTALDILPSFGLSLPRPPAEYDLALALGGGEVRLLDLTSAYGILADGGAHTPPRLILEVTTLQGEPLYTAPAVAPQQVLDARVAWLLSDILSDNQARLISFGSNSVLNLGRTAAVKTGTTNDFRDNWTVGYTPNVVVGVWVGNADQSPMVDATGLTGAGPIWHNFMRQVLKNVPDAPFPRPAGLVQMAVCYPSGQLPTAACPYQQQEWFIEGTQPRTADTLYHAIVLDKLTGRVATAGTPTADRVPTLALDLPPQAHTWAKAQGVTLLADVQLPALNSAEGQGPTAEAGPQLYLLTPANNVTYQFSTELPADAQKVRLAAAADLPLAQLTFWLNDEPVATLTQAPYEFWWPLSLGQFELWAEGQTAAGTTLRTDSTFFVVRQADD